jgi:hypothetical protein
MPSSQQNQHQAVTPNLYRLTGHRVHVTFTTTSIDGKPSLSYQDAHQSKSFRGDEVRIVECDLGSLVSVTLQNTPDVGSTTLSLMIPRTQITHGQHASLRTYCITTLHSTSFAPAAVHGQMESYEALDLHGTAQHVMF